MAPEQNQHDFNSTQDMDEAREQEVVRARVSKFEKMRLSYESKMRQVREQVLDAFNTAKAYRSYDEVIEEAKAFIVDIFSLLKPLCSRKRPLKPEREATSHTTFMSLAVTPLNLSISILGAVDLPLPSDKSQLRPFVEANFQGNSIRTVALLGNSPEWGASLELPLRLKSVNQRPETMSDELVLNVFNDRTYSRPTEGGQELSSVMVQEKHFLGSVAIPFSTIYVNEKVKGRLQLRVPDHLIGYGGPDAAGAGIAAPSAATDDAGAPRQQHRRRLPALKVFICLQPHLARPNIVQQTFDTAHEPERHWVYATKQSLARLSDQVNQELRQRQTDQSNMTDEFLYNPRAFVVSMEVKEVFVSCYINPAGMQPPDELFHRGSREVTDLEQRKFIAARYVSLVPFVSDAAAFPGLIDIWNTCEEFLDYQAGDEEEHAVLLANYLTHMTHGDASTNIYLVLGNAVPEGATAYVLEMSDKETFVWNPSQGTRFRAQSDRSPLVSIDCLINATGVYVNKNPFEEHRVLNNPVTAQQFWLHIAKPEGPTFYCIQAPVTYASDAVLTSEIGNIEYEIEFAVRKGIEGLRARVPTLWYNGGAKDVRELLKALETFHFDHDCREIATAKENFYRTFGAKIVVGYPLQMCYKSTAEILDEVKNTKIHEIGLYVDSKDPMPKIQFSCVVYVHQYPKSVLSIWVNLMALKK